MSRRYFPRYLAAGLLAAAVAPPGPAQTRVRATEVDVAPAPRPVVQYVSPTDCGLPIPVRGPSPLWVERDGYVGMGPTSSCCPTPRLELAPGQFSGTFYREMPGLVAALTVYGNDAKLVVTVNADGTTGTITLTAHAATTADGTVHGVITGADVDVSGNPAAGMELAAIALELQQCVDQPFAFRARPSDGGLMVSGFKTTVSGLDPSMLAAFAGKYKAAVKGVVPAAKGKVAGRPVCDLGSRLEAAEQVFRVQPIPCPDLPRPSPPSRAPADVGGVMVTEFQKMFGAASGSMTLPSPRYLNHVPQYVAPEPAFPLPRELVVQPTTPTVSYPMPLGQPVPPLSTTPVPVMPVAFPPPPPVPVVTPVRPVGAAPLGTWYREVGPVLFTVVVKDGHITITSKMAVEVGGKTVTQGVVLTGDYHVTRDGSNLVGLITGVDAVVEGDMPQGMEPDTIVKFQKAMTDKPFALSFRVYDNTLVVGNVRLPEWGDKEQSDALTAIGGRYAAAGDKPSPKPKATKPATRVSEGNRFAPDPHVRIQRLLEQTESPRPAGEEWRKFWFHHKPPHLTPERIHGGII
jgi:hypothetical protein